MNLFDKQFWNNTGTTIKKEFLEFGNYFKKMKIRR